MYADVKEIHPGAAQRLQSALRQSAAVAAGSSAQHQSVTLRQPGSTPPTSGQGVNSSQQIPNPGVSPADSANPYAGSSSTGSSLSPNPTSTPQYVLLCVNTKRLKTLEHIEVTSFDNDQYLFQAIREAYQRIRKAHQWNISMLLPSWIRKLSWVPPIDNLTLSIPRSANFVRVSINSCFTFVCQ